MKPAGCSFLFDMTRWDFPRKPDGTLTTQVRATSLLRGQSTHIPGPQAMKAWGIWTPASRGQPHADLEPSRCLGVSDGHLWPVSSAHDIIFSGFIASLGGKEVFSFPSANSSQSANRHRDGLWSGLRSSMEMKFGK